MIDETTVQEPSAENLTAEELTMAVEDDTASDDGMAAVVEAPAADRPRLVVKRSGAETDEVFDLNPPSMIGRFDPAVGPIDVDLGPLPEGVYVSRKHAKITCEDGIWKLHDLGSSNGTFILRGDFERIEEAELADGDEIALGNARFVFRLAESQ